VSESEQKDFGNSKCEQVIVCIILMNTGSVIMDLNVKFNILALLTRQRSLPEHKIQFGRQASYETNQGKYRKL